MAHIILFHSVQGLREVELAAAERFRAAGHEVTTPDLYEGQTAATIDEGIAIKDQIGWDTLIERANAACVGLPDKAVLAGLSMGSAVACTLWAKRTATTGILLIHGLGELPKWVKSGLPVQAHFADPDPYLLETVAADWNDRAFRVGLALEIFTYDGVGHFYTDAASADYNAEATEQTFERALSFLESL